MQDSGSDSTNHQNVISEGPIMISTTEVKGEFVMSQLRDQIADAILKGYLANEENTRVLILSGSHGDGDSGDSGLSNIEKLKDADDKNAGDITSKFYEGDCRRAGISPLKPRLDIQKLPLADKNIPDITKMKKLNPLFFKNSYLSDNDICKITFQVVNIAYYHKNESRLVQDIKRFDPKILAVAWCFSINGDVSRALRQEGIFAKMAMEHDYRECTKNPYANPFDESQAEITKKIVKLDEKKLMSRIDSEKKLQLEALLYSIDKLRSMKKDGKKLCCFIGVINKDKDSALIEKMKQKYFKNIVNEKFIEFFSVDEMEKFKAENAEMEIQFMENQLVYPVHPGWPEQGRLRHDDLRRIRDTFMLCILSTELNTVWGQPVEAIL